MDEVKHYFKDRIKNKEIIDHFVHLNYSQKRILLKSIDSHTRSVLLSIIKNNGDVVFEDQLRNNLSKKIDQAAEFSPRITRLTDRSTIISKIKKSFKGFLDNFFYLFNFVTVTKADQLIQQELIRKRLITQTAPLANREQVDKILKEAGQSTEKVNLAEKLVEKGFLPEIHELQLSNNLFLNPISLDGMTFVRCISDWTDLSQKEINKVRFINCALSNLSFAESKLEKCDFINCKMQEVMFVATSLKNVNFNKCDLRGCSFEDAELSKCRFKNVNMPGTHFLEAVIEQSSIKSSRLRDVVFFWNSRTI